MGLVLMEKDLPGKGVNLLRVRTVNAFQGNEAPFIVLDLTISDKLGFVAQRNRLNVALTRAQENLILIADVAAISRAQASRTTSQYLLGVLRDYRTGRHYFEIREDKPMRQSPYIPEEYKSRTSWEDVGFSTTRFKTLSTIIEPSASTLQHLLSLYQPSRHPITISPL